MSNRFVRHRIDQLDNTRSSDSFTSRSWVFSARFWTALSSIAALAATVFAGWAAWENHNSAMEAPRATRAAVWMQTLSEYASPEMLDAMKELRSWQQQHPADFAEQFEVLLVNDGPSIEQRELADRLDADRRRVSSFFSKVVTLDKMGVLSGNEAALSWDVATYDYIKDLIGPMEHAKVDSMRRKGLVTAAQVAEADRGEDVVFRFYARVAEAHKLVRISP